MAFRKTQNTYVYDNIDKSRKNAEVLINEEKIEKHKKYKWNQHNAVSYSTDTFNK